MLVVDNRSGSAANRCVAHVRWLWFCSCSVADVVEPASTTPKSTTCDGENWTRHVMCLHVRRRGTPIGQPQRTSSWS